MTSNPEDIILVQHLATGKVKPTRRSVAETDSTTSKDAKGKVFDRVPIYRIISSDEPAAKLALELVRIKRVILTALATDYDAISSGIIAKYMKTPDEFIAWVEHLSATPQAQPKDIDVLQQWATTLKWGIQTILPLRKRAAEIDNKLRDIGLQHTLDYMNNLKTATRERTKRERIESLRLDAEIQAEAQPPGTRQSVKKKAE